MLVRHLSPGQLAQVEAMVSQLIRAGLLKAFEAIGTRGPERARIDSELAKLGAALDLTEAIAKTGTAPLVLDAGTRNQLRMVRTRAKALAVTTADRLAKASRAGNTALARTLSNNLTQLTETIRQVDEIVGVEEPPAQPVRQR